MMKDKAPSLVEARKASDDWTAIDMGRERKKIQNRLNQRARRRRTAASSKQTSAKFSYKVDSWRINELVTPILSPKIPARIISPDVVFPIEVSTYSQGPILESLTVDYTSLNSDTQSSELDNSSSLHQFSAEPSDAGLFPMSSVIFPMSADHLLHLIHYNVFRAIKSNKTILNMTTSLTRPNVNIPIQPSTTTLCDGLTLIHPMGISLPSSLHPTPLQMGYPHPSWMNVFPFSPIRDNLISFVGIYDEFDFLKDIVGEAYFTPSPDEFPESYADASKTLLPTSDDDDYDTDVAARRKGLIVWGEPWDVQSWEATPGFLRKWGWLLGGYEDLIRASNYWREKRGEEPLPHTAIEV